MRIYFKPHSDIEVEYHISAGFFRRATLDSITDFDGSSCMIYEDNEHEVYQSQSPMRCAIVGFSFSSIALLYLILAMFGVARHKKRESICLGVLSIIVGILMCIAQRLSAHNVCDIDTYSRWDEWILHAPEFPQFEYFKGCKYGVQAVCGLIACLMWFSAGVLLCCNARYTKTLIQLERKEEFKKREQARADFYEKDDNRCHKTFMKEEEELNARRLKTIRLNNLLASREHSAVFEARSKRKLDSTQPDLRQDNVSKIEVPEGTDDIKRSFDVPVTSEVVLPVAEIIICDASTSTSDESEHVVGSGENSGVPIISSIERFDHGGEENTGDLKPTVENFDKGIIFDNGDSSLLGDSPSSIPNINIGDEEEHGPNVIRRNSTSLSSVIEGCTNSRSETSSHQSFFDDDGISLAGTQDHTAISGLSYGDTTTMTPVLRNVNTEDVPNNKKTAVHQNSTITMDEEIE